MSIMSAIVLYCSIWAVVFFMVLPLGVVSQSEAGHVDPGTPASAPTDAMVARKMLATTAVAALLWAAAFAVIEFQLFTLDDITFLDPPSGHYADVK
jgi:predicted secreted protein